METPTTRAAPRLKFTQAVARIDEEECIGCALCLAACPVDAILGAAQWLHAVIEEQCIGCELCLPVCPVDCIAMAPEPAAASGAPGAPETPELPEALQRRMRDAARRIKARKRRLAREDERRKSARDTARQALQRRVAAATGDARSG